MNDGDRSLVVGDKRFVEIAERNMQDTVPLYYEMGVAAPQIISNQTLYEGMVLAYTTGNIGVPSNDISKGFDCDEVDMDAIKIQAAMVNYTIDTAKTLYKPELPKEIQQRIRKHTNRKLPHFFIYAKGKKESNVEQINESTVNRIKKYVPKQNLKFSSLTQGKFNYKILMHDRSIECNDLYNAVIAKYRKLSKNVNMFSNDNRGESNNYNHIFREIRKSLEDICGDTYLLTDMLIHNLFGVRNSKHKTVFWNCFGDIVFENLTNNMIDNYIYCTKCGKRFYREHHNETLCENCKGYQPIEKKIIVCVDCGKEFEANALANKKIRCNECYKKYRKEYNNQKKREERLK